MPRSNFPILLPLILLGTAVFARSAATKVDQETLGPDGESLGCMVSPKGNHVAVLAAKGSRFAVLLDGVEGPRIEALLNNVGGSAVQLSSYWMGQVPILFSDDGAHSAYIGKIGDEFVVFQDGKELSRGPIRQVSQSTVPLCFSAGGKHLFYMTSDTVGKYQIVVDGKPGPGLGFPPTLAISPDGAHYAYVGYDRASGPPMWAIVDGRQVNYFGDNLQYTGRSVLTARLNADNATTLLLNGKPEIKAARLDPTWMSPDGLQIAMVVTPKNTDPGTLTINGKPVPETQGLVVEQVYFSPDGKRYAALCHTKANAKFMIIDGKKGEEYQTIPPTTGSSGSFSHWQFVTGSSPASIPSVQLPVPGFTADSTKFVYVAGQGARQFMVVDDQESSGFQSPLEPILSPVGHRIGLIAVAPNGKQHVLLDGKDQEYGPPQVVGGVPGRIHDLVFTPDGSRCAYVNGPSLVVDGVTLPGYVMGAEFALSPDNKHVVYLANDSGTLRLFLDGKIVDDSPFNLAHPFFSPDSQHLFWTRTANFPGTKDSTMFYVDGKPATHFSDAGLGAGHPVNFEFSPDGVVTFVARIDENLRRFHVTPSPETNITTMLAAGKAPKDK